MLSVLREIKDYDTIFFTPHEEEDNQVKVEVASYKERGTPIDASFMGDMFDIILFRLDEEDNVQDFDHFQGILVDPRVYVTRMIGEDWYGVVSRKTTTSGNFIQKIVDEWKNL